MDAPVLNDLLKLDLETRLELISQLWDSIVDADSELPLGLDDREELDRRLAAYRREPAAGAPWSDVRARIFRRG